jgi:hypothetical protein
MVIHYQEIVTTRMSADHAQGLAALTDWVLWFHISPLALKMSLLKADLNSQFIRSSRTVLGVDRASMTILNLSISSLALISVVLVKELLDSILSVLIILLQLSSTMLNSLMSSKRLLFTCSLLLKVGLIVMIVVYSLAQLL